MPSVMQLGGETGDLGGFDAQHFDGFRQIRQPQVAGLARQGVQGLPQDGGIPGQRAGTTMFTRGTAAMFTRGTAAMIERGTAAMIERRTAAMIERAGHHAASAARSWRRSTEPGMAHFVRALARACSLTSISAAATG